MIKDSLAAADLTIYACIGLVLFLAIFGAVLERVFSQRHDHKWKLASRLPLSDGRPHRQAGVPPRPENQENADD